MIQLDRPLDLGSTSTRSICLPEKDEDFSDQVCVVAGWGNYKKVPKGKQGNKRSDFLKAAHLPILSSARCRLYIGVPNNYICAARIGGGEGPCLRDSGGPLACLREDGVWKLAGVVVGGDGCGAPESPGIYAEVSKFLEEIGHYAPDLKPKK